MADGVLAKIKRFVIGADKSLVGQMNVIGTSEAAILTGLSMRHIRRLCEQQRVRAVRIGTRSWAIDRKSLESFVKAKNRRKKSR